MAQESVTEIAEFCEELVGRMALELSVTAEASGSTLLVNLSGPDRALLLQSSAALLNAIEYLVNKTFRTGKDAAIEAIVLDTDHYRQHREAELVLLAQMASKTVLQQRRPMSLQPMTPKERRIVHLALSAIDGVRSESQGDGDNRSITIYPAS